MQPSDNRLLNYSERLRRLRYLAIGFLLFLLIPLGTILYFGFQQLEKKLLDEYQFHAKKLENVIDRRLTERRMISNTLPVDVFDYYRWVYNPYTKKAEQILSPISRLEYEQPLNKWLVGYFQYCNRGHFNSPIWPDSVHNNNRYKTNSANMYQEVPDNELTPELLLRKNRAINTYQLLSQSKSVQQLIQEMRYYKFSPKNELFSVSFDLPDYFIFHRYVSIANDYWLQGYIVKRKPYLSQLVKDMLERIHFDSPVLVELKNEKKPTQSEYFLFEKLANGEAKVVSLTKPDKVFQEQHIYKCNFMRSFDGYSLTFTTNSLPMTPAMIYSIGFILILIIAILSACYGFYRLGLKQLALGEQRLNFVSSVSHELKTPLTSIRMYSQMLKEGTVASSARQSDYFNFIHDESERLTRLINNILQLSTLSNHQHQLQPKYTPLPLLIDLIRSKTSSIMEKHHFQQEILYDGVDVENVLVYVEQDAFAQVMINITDNSVKFFNSKKIHDLGRQKIEFIIRDHPKQKNMIELEIRDYGDGVTTEQERKLFELFYRGGDELTRTAQGTGIGLALVRELVKGQQGEIRAERKNPGLAMVISFKCKRMDVHGKTGLY